VPKRKSCTFPSASSKAVNSSRSLSTVPAETRIHLSGLSDEDLCRRAQHGCNISKEFLWDRCQGYIQKLVKNENRRRHLAWYEMDDVLQELYFAFHKAVQRYDPEGHCEGKPATFKTFLRVVVIRSFSNYCSLSRIYHKHVVLDFDVNLCWSCLAEGKHTDNRESSLADWLELLLNEFSSRGLVAAVRKLKGKEKCFLALWLQCDLDNQVARVLGISPAAAKLRRERIFHHIRQYTSEK
jgi:DNA-directed RNA polymerase specialized sigma24 family protein